MEKKTMGAFIAALRKANGMTQQELADKLNISNKAVSRWERDECSPDISLIPALAEILGVTCDELLKGERILSNSVQEKSEPKVEKQVKAILNRSMANFKMMIWISIAISIVGLICMFGISYGAYRTLIGIIVMGVFAVAAFTVAAIFTSKLKGKMDNELFDSADESLIHKFNHTLGAYSYVAFCAVILVVAVSVPYLFFSSTYNHGVLTFSSYLTLFGGIAPTLVLIFLALKGRYCAWITGQPYVRESGEKNPRLLLLNIVQLAVIGVVIIVLFVCPLFETYNEIWSMSDALLVVAMFLPVACTVIFIIFIAISKNRKTLLLSGIRNILLSLPPLLVRFACKTTFNEVNGQMERSINWNLNLILIGINLTLFIFMVFEIIKAFKNKKEV